MRAVWVLAGLVGCGTPGEGGATDAGGTGTDTGTNTNTNTNTTPASASEGGPGTADDAGTASDTGTEPDGEASQDGGSASSGGEVTPSVGIWISVDEILALPTDGPAWEAVLADAQADAGLPNLSDQDQDNNVLVLAKAFVCVRLDDEAMCDVVRQDVVNAMNTEDGGRTLALGRELMAYVIAADLVGLAPSDDETFRAWLADVIHEDLEGRTLVTTHEERPNNWGTHAGASRVAAAVYLGDDEELQRCAEVFEGWLGNRSVYADFSYGELWWQSNPTEPVGINPVGAMIQGQDVDGVLPDDQRRAGAFAWPPPQENYVWEALQGAFAQAVILERQGFDAWGWQDEALRRAVVWLHEQADYPADGDDTWLPYLANHAYGTDFPVVVPSRPGKNVGYTDWTHAP